MARQIRSAEPSSTPVSGGGGGSRKRSRSASAIVADTASGHHILRIDGYSRTKGIATGGSLKSRPFTVGGHRWHIDYRPNGSDANSKDYISLFLVLVEPAAGLAGKVVKAQHLFRFVGEVSEEEEMPPALLAAEGVNSYGNSYGSQPGWGVTKFVRREDLERSEHLKDDCFAVRCDIVVINDFRVEDETADFVSVPPSDLHQHLGDLLRNGKGADVVFEVGGETFPAQRCVLAARSPVFTAQFFGAMKESRSGSVVHIDDMDARVFKALLHFIYTDLFSETNQDGEEDVMVQHLLVAADKYNLARLKLVCEDKLCKYIDVDTVATILALADQHHCQGLRKACFRFLSSSDNLKLVVASESFDHLSKNCPSVMKELVAMLGKAGTI